MNIIDHINRLDEELECLWTEIPPPGEEGRQAYLDEIDRLSKTRETLVKQVRSEESRSDKVLKWIPAVVSIFGGIVTPVVGMILWSHKVDQAWINEDKTILSSQTSKNYVMRGLNDLFKI